MNSITLLLCCLVLSVLSSTESNRETTTTRTTTTQSSETIELNLDSHWRCRSFYVSSSVLKFSYYYENLMLIWHPKCEFFILWKLIRYTIAVHKQNIITFLNGYEGDKVWKIVFDWGTCLASLTVSDLF